MKNRKGKIIIAVVAAFTFFGMVMYTFMSEYIANAFALMTKNDTEYFKWAADRQIDRTVRAINFAGDTSGLVNTRRQLIGNEISADFVLDVSDELSDMLGLVYFKRDEIKSTLTIENNRIGLELVPKYGDDELLTIKALAEPSAKLLYAQIPDYREDIVEMSSLYEKPVPGGYTVGEILSGIMDDANTSGFASYNGFGAVYSLKMHKLVDSFDEAAVEKRFTVRVGEEEKKYTRITLKTDKLKFVEQLEKLIGSDIKGECDIYVDRKGDFCGGELRFAISATKIAVNIMNTSNGADMTVTVNSINAATATQEIALKDRSLTSKLEINLETFVKTLLGIRGNLKLAINTSVTRNDTSLTVEALKDGVSKGMFGVTCNIAPYREDVLNTEGLKIYDFDTILGSKYFDAPALATFALGILDRVNEDFVNDYIDSLLDGFLGSEVSIDSLRNMLDTGMLDMFSGTGPAIGEEPEPEPEPEPTIPGIECVAPEEFVTRTWKYPANDDSFSYSHEYLAGYADISRYRGIEYAVPVSEGITDTQLEERKQKYLAKYEGMFFEDEKTIEVQNGDEVYFDIVPILGGYPMTMYAYDDCYELMGTEQYGEGLDEKILGMHVGEIRDVEATLGDQFGDFAGYTGIFRVTLTSIVRETKPSWTKEFVCGRLKYDSLEACEQYLMDQLISEADVSEDAVRSVLVNIVWDNTTMKSLSEELTNRLRQERYDALYEQTVSSGLSPIQTYLAEDRTLDQLVKDLDDSIALDLPEYCFYGTLAKAENITLTGQEVGELVREYLKAYELDSFDNLMEKITLDEIVDEEIKKRIDQLIYDTAVVSYR